MTVYALKTTLDELSRQNVIDSRDIVERVNEIEEDIAAIDDDALPDVEGHIAADRKELQDELDILNELVEVIDGYSGDSAKDGVTLVAESYWVEYAQELADDIGALPKEFSWPTSYIDWDRAASDLKMDYTSVQIGSEDYWFR